MKKKNFQPLPEMFVISCLAGGIALASATMVRAGELPVTTSDLFVEKVRPPYAPPPAGLEFERAIGPDVNVSNLMGNESEVLIDINPTDPDNLVIAAHAPGFSVMNTFFTTDGGLTWTRVPLGPADDGIASTFRFDPTVAFDDSGNVYVAYGARHGVPSQVTVVVARSTDGGANYTQFTAVDTNTDIKTLPGNDKWHLATGPDPFNPAQQNVYMAWTQNVLEGAAVDQRIVASVSTDGGATFSTPVIVNDASISGTKAGNLFADPAVGPNGELYVAWHSISTSQVLVDVSFDRGATFGPDHPATTSGTGFKNPVPPQPDRGIFVGPTLDVDRSGGPFNGRLYVAYTDVPGGLPDTDIFVRFSDDDGATWSPPVLVNDDGGPNSQFLPWLDVDQATGRVSVTWYDARNDALNQRVEVFLASSNDGGAAFGTNLRVSDGQSDQSFGNPFRWGNNFLEYIGVAAYDGVAHAAWADNSTNLADLDVFTDRVPTAIADLAVSKTDSPDPVLPTQNLTYAVTVTNNGPEDAAEVILTDTLPPGVSFVSTTATQGACMEAAGIVTCGLGDLTNAASATLTIAVLPAEEGAIVNTVDVAGKVSDLLPANNTASEETTVLSAADLSVTKTGSPEPATAHEDNVTYNLTVTNNGPSDATGVTLTDTLPAAVGFVSAASSQGACMEAVGVVTCNLGDLANAGCATVTIVVAPTAAGKITNTATVAGNEFDPDPASDTAMEDTAVVEVPAGSHVLSARVFVDYRCNRFFINGLDKPIPDVPVRLSFTDGAKIIRMTTWKGFVSFTGFDVPPDGVTVSVMLPPTFRGRTLAPCPNSLRSRALEAADFGAFGKKFVAFGAQLLP